MSSPIEEALGPIRPEVVGWRVGRRVKKNGPFDLGHIHRVSPEAADVLDVVKREAAARCIPFPRAVVLILAHVVAASPAPSEGGVSGQGGEKTPSRGRTGPSQAK